MAVCSTPHTQKYRRRKYDEKKKRLWVELQTSPIKGKVKKQRLRGRKRIKQLSSTTHQRKRCLATSQETGPQYMEQFLIKTGVFITSILPFPSAFQTLIAEHDIIDCKISFGQFTSPVLAVFPPHLLPIHSLLVWGDRSESWCCASNAQQQKKKKTKQKKTLLSQKCSKAL